MSSKERQAVEWVRSGQADVALKKIKEHNQLNKEWNVQFDIENRKSEERWNAAIKNLSALVLGNAQHAKN
jgi:hypothetical protein